MFNVSRGRCIPQVAASDAAGQQRELQAVATAAQKDRWQAEDGLRRVQVEVRLGTAFLVLCCRLCIWWRWRRKIAGRRRTGWRASGEGCALVPLSWYLFYVCTVLCLKARAYFLRMPDLFLFNGATMVDSS